MEIGAEKERIALSLAVQLLREDKSVTEVVDALSAMGIDEITALDTVARSIPLAHPMEPVNPRREAWEDLKIGLGLLVLAAGISLASFAFVEARGSGRYFVAGGAVLVATIYLLKGAWRAIRK